MSLDQSIMKCFLLAAAVVCSVLNAAMANSAIVPVPREKPEAIAQHNKFVERAKRGNIDVLFIGDSITNHWRNPQRGKPIWDAYFAPLNAVNFGISSDRTEHVLWRLRNGEGEGYSPKAVVLLIGTNNMGMRKDSPVPYNTPEETVEGITAVVQELRVRFPSAKILLLGVFPRNEPESDRRRQVREVNAAIAKLDDREHVFFLDIGHLFLLEDGTIPKAFMPDLVHPSRKGYEIWGNAIREPLAELLK